MTTKTAKKFVKSMYPDAICVDHSLIYEGVETLWRVIEVDHDRHSRWYKMEIGASSTSEDQAWINAVPNLKDFILCQMEKKFGL